MRKGEYGLIALAAIICAVVLIGEYVTYGDVFDYDSSADADGNYSIYDSGSHSYTAVLTDNGSFSAPTELYIYLDGDYGSVVHDVNVEVGAKKLTQSYYLEQLVNNLKYYSVQKPAYLDARGLEELMSQTGQGKGVVVISGALPDTVYSGTSGDKAVSWLTSGGTLYWAGESIGRYIGHADGSCTEAPSGYAGLFLGTGAVLNGEEEDTRAYSDVGGNAYRYDLSLKNNDVKYAVSVGSVSDALAVGYERDGFASIVLAKNGTGMVCVFGGDYSNNQRMDMANVIASGICYCSVEVECHTGTVARGTVRGTFSDLSGTHGNLCVFLYLGGDFSVYGKLYQFGS